jgi:UTP--glucose-1-phosphate uridylyltransferase
MLRLAETQPFYGCRFKGRTYDCGAKLGFLVANVAFALDREDLAADLKAEILALLKR